MYWFTPVGQCPMLLNCSFWTVSQSLIIMLCLRQQKDSLCFSLHLWMMKNHLWLKLLQLCPVLFLLQNVLLTKGNRQRSREVELWQNWGQVKAKLISFKIRNLFSPVVRAGEAYSPSSLIAHPQGKRMRFHMSDHPNPPVLHIFIIKLYMWIL